jgi:hypothetical protein
LILVRETELKDLKDEILVLHGAHLSMSKCPNYIERAK